jgi:hypothetical protein
MLCVAVASMFTQRFLRMMDYVAVLIFDVFEIGVGIFVYPAELFDHVSNTSPHIPALEKVNANTLLAREGRVSLLSVE